MLISFVMVQSPVYSLTRPQFGGRFFSWRSIREFCRSSWCWGLHISYPHSWMKCLLLWHHLAHSYHFFDFVCRSGYIQNKNICPCHALPLEISMSCWPPTSPWPPANRLEGRLDDCGRKMCAQKCLAQWVDISDEMAEELADVGNFTRKKIGIQPSGNGGFLSWGCPKMNGL